MKLGRIEVVVGGMFSGKSEELIRRVRRARIANQGVLVLKPQLDDRYATHAVVSHLQNEIPCIPVPHSKEVLPRVGEDIRVVAFDEAQFFDEGLFDVVQALVARGKRVILAGLDMDSEGRPFGQMPALMAVAEEVLKLHAVCVQCGSDASFTFHEGSKLNQVEVGAAQYEARCRSCWAPPF